MTLAFEVDGLTGCTVCHRSVDRRRHVFLVNRLSTNARYSLQSRPWCLSRNASNLLFWPKAPLHPRVLLPIKARTAGCKLMKLFCWLCVIMAMSLSICRVFRETSNCASLRILGTCMRQTGLRITTFIAWLFVARLCIAPSAASLAAHVGVHRGSAASLLCSFASAGGKPLGLQLRSAKCAPSVELEDDVRCRRGWRPLRTASSSWLQRVGLTWVTGQAGETFSMCA